MSDDAAQRAKRTQEIQLQFQCKVQDDTVVFSLEDVEVFSLIFHSENFINALYEKLKPENPYLAISAEQRPKIYDAVRKVLADEQGDFTDEQISKHEQEALRVIGLEIFRNSIEVT
ncbi:MAG: hypothetical protein QOE47_1457, partial [Pyrinomonadaceae bacterium]|nr:hypothetical protein [Pyrinomonadaceae bacterium]